MKKVIVITGATKGIGMATSELLSMNNYEVVGIARHEIKNFPGHLFSCDLTDSKITMKTLLEIKKLYSCQIVGVVNNVGIALPQPLEEVDLKSLYEVFDLNVRTALQTTQTFIEQMKVNKYGRIVNIGSRAIFGVKNRTSYAAAKSALIGLTKTWALELAPYQITVNTISPGPVETELFRKTRPIGSEAEKQVLEAIPLGRLGQPKEIASIIKFILSEDASFITGQNICIDGGSSL
jgi:3-oxoacyl-[acyl-carrier protein] reductase